MIIVILLLLILLSFSLHIFYLIQYVTLRKPKYLKMFINTAVTNIVIAGCITLLSLYNPEYIYKLDIKLLTWAISGFIMVMMIAIKIIVLIKIYKKAQDPDNFHYNFFGKKVLHSTVASKVDILVFFVTMPFFLLFGAYFVARLVNLILYGYL